MRNCVASQKQGSQPLSLGHLSLTVSGLSDVGMPSQCSLKVVERGVCRLWLCCELCGCRWRPAVYWHYMQTSTAAAAMQCRIALQICGIYCSSRSSIGLLLSMGCVKHVLVPAMHMHACATCAVPGCTVIAALFLLQRCAVPGSAAHSVRFTGGTQMDYFGASWVEMGEMVTVNPVMILPAQDCCLQSRAGLET